MIEATLTPSEKVYVCFLPTNIDEESVKQMFQQFGIITHFQLCRRKDGFTYAHITFESIKQAEAAIKKMNKMKMEQYVLKVSFAVSNCVPKWKKFKSKGKSLKIQKSSEQYLKIGNKMSKKQMKKLKKEHKNQDQKLEYLEQVEQALKKILEEGNKIRQKKKQREQKKEKEQKEVHVSISDLNVFKSWLKTKEKPSAEKQGSETEWSGELDLVDVKKLEKNQCS